MTDRRILLVGNPGVGKSTLLNSLIGTAAFMSGISVGTGMTQILQWHKHKDAFYGDTPGLADVKMREKAAAEIEKALKANGSYKLVFVCTEESGRVRPQDVATMKLVLDALPSDVPYGVVVNKVGEKLRGRIEQSPDMAQALFTTLNAGHRSTPFIFLHKRVEKLVDEDNAVVAPDPSFVEFLDVLPEKVIAPPDVKHVQADQFAALEAKYEAELAKLKADAVSQKKEFDRQLADARSEISRLKSPDSDPFSRFLQIASGILQLGVHVNALLTKK